VFAPSARPKSKMQLSPSLSYVFLLLVLTTGAPHKPFDWRAAPRQSAGVIQKSVHANVVKTAALLRTRARTGARDVDLSLAGDRLQGIMDAVNTRFVDVRTALTSVTTSCEEEIAKSVERTKAQNDEIADLETVQTQQAGVQGRLQAELDHLRRGEDEAKSSYDSTVALRAKGRQAFVDRNATLTDQEAVVGQVLETMKEQEAVEGSAAGAASLLSMSMKKAQSSGPSGGFATIIGIFTNMQDTLQHQLQEDSVDHTKKDKEYLALVNSHKKMLQNLDAEYETKNAQKMTAQVTARDASFEKNLRNDISKGDARSDSALREMCGHERAKVPAALASGERLLARLQGQVTRALASIDELPALAEPAAAFTQLRAAGRAQIQRTVPKKVPAKAPNSPATQMAVNPIAKRAAAKQVATNSSIGKSLQKAPVPLSSNHQLSGSLGEVLRLGRDAQARHPSWHLNKTSTSLPVSIIKRKNPVVAAPKSQLPSVPLSKPSKERNAKTAAMWALLHASEATKDDALRTMAETLPLKSISQDLHILATFSQKLETDSNVKKRKTGDDEEDGELSGELQTCVDDKRRLTGEIVTARQAARGARTQAASAKARRDAIAGWLSLVDAQKTALEEAETSHTSATDGLAAAGSTMDSDLADAIGEMDGVEAELATYRGTDGAPPKAAALEIAFKGIRSSLISLKDKTPNDVTALSADSQNLKITYQALMNTLDGKETELNDDKTAQETSLSSAEADVTTHEQTESDLMAQRTTVEEDCEAHMTSGAAAAVNLMVHNRQVESAALGVATQLLTEI